VDEVKSEHLFFVCVHVACSLASGAHKKSPSSCPPLTIVAALFAQIRQLLFLPEMTNEEDQEFRRDHPWLYQLEEQEAAEQN